jgi:hypothetical protein
MASLHKTFVIRIARANDAAARPPLGRVAADHVEDFRPAAARYRRHWRRFVQCAALGVALAIAGLCLPERMLPWVAGPGAALVVLALILFFTLPSLGCPACMKNADGSPDRFCPACGSDQIRVNRLCGSYCNGCGRRFGSARYRNHPIRYCTHCGVVLDEAGV